MLKWLRLEMEESGFVLDKEQWTFLSQLIETSSLEQKKRIKNRVLDRYKNKENFETIVNHLFNNLNKGIIH